MEKQTGTMTEHLKKQIALLEMQRSQWRSNWQIDDEYKESVIETLNTMIGRICCYLTDDDTELEKLARKHGLRGAE